MLSEEEKEIYSRHLLLTEVGVDGQIKLKLASVLVIGAGGLGCPVLQYLCAAGVGNIGIADNDTVDKSNLQRQILFGHSSIGKPKVNEAKKKLNDINPYVNIEVFPLGITVDNALDIFEKYDIIVDCTDNYPTRYLVNDACFLLQKPLVYGAIHKFEGQVTVFNFKDGPTYRCIYPETPKEASISNCSESGVIGILPGIIGTFQANETIKLITGIGELLNGKLLLYNSLKNTVNTFIIKRQKLEFYDNLRRKNQLRSIDYDISCETIGENQVNQIELNYDQIIDVRELNEQPRLNLTNLLAIPLNQIETRIGEIDKKKNTLVICQSGIRSQKAIDYILGKFEMNKIDNLEGGVISLLDKK